MISRIYLILFCCISIANELPIGFTEEEWENRHLIQTMGRETDPPLGPIRNIAEYEPMQGALIRYPFGVSISIIIILMLINYFDVKSANEIKTEVLKPFIGVFIIWYIFLKGPKKGKQTNSFIPVGLIAGLSSIFIGAVGPLIAPFFLSKNLNKEQIIANKAVSQMITHLSKIPLFIYFFNMNYKTELNILVPLIIAVYIGTNFGKKILSFIPENLFRKIFKLTLFIIAIRLILI